MYGRLRHPLFLTLDWSFQATYGCSASKTYRQTDWKLIEYLLAQHSPGGPFSKDLVTYTAWKATLEIMIHLLWESAILICFRYKERQNNCQVSKLETCSYWRYKGIFVTCKILRCLRNGPYNTLQSRCVSDREEIFSNIRHHFWSRIGSKRMGKGREKDSKKNVSAYRCPSPPLPIFSLSHHLRQLWVCANPLPTNICLLCRLSHEYPLSILKCCYHHHLYMNIMEQYSWQPLTVILLYP